MQVELLVEGDSLLWNAFMDELRHLHFGAPRPARSMFGELQTASKEVRARSA